MVAFNRASLALMSGTLHFHTAHDIPNPLEKVQREAEDPSL